MGSRNRKPKRTGIKRGAIQRQRRTENAGRSLSVTRTEACWVGPLPPPAVLKEFDDIVPGLGREIGSAFVDEGRMRRTIEDRQSKTAMFQGIAGPIFAFLLSGGMIFGGITLLMNDKPTAGVFAFFGALVPVVTGLLIRKK